MFDYIRQIRITKAKELLSLDDMKVGDIPMIIGLTNLSNFYSTFKKDVDLTSAAYREYILSKKTSE
jgi:AraC-type DNA-binding domain-containing proteins